MRLRWVALGWIAVWLVGSPQAGAAALARTPLATEPKPVKVASYKDVVVWSHASHGGYELMVRQGGVVTVAPIRPRRVPFDVDLGPDAHGRVAAVYTRCSHDVDYSFPKELPRYEDARGCRLYRYVIGNKQEQEIRVAARARSLFLPSIWRRRIALGIEDRRGIVGVELLRLGGDHRPRPIGPQIEADAATYPTQIDIRDEVIGAGWDFGTQGCSPAERVTQATRVFEIRLGQRVRTLAHACLESTPARVGFPTVGAHGIAFYEQPDTSNPVIIGPGPYRPTYTLDAAALSLTLNGGSAFYGLFFDDSTATYQVDQLTR